MEFGSMSCCRRATSEEAPKSIAKRVPPASTRMQVWKRPPLPKESPEPTNRAVAVTWSSLGAQPASSAGWIIPWYTRVSVRGEVGHAQTAPWIQRRTLGRHRRPDGQPAGAGGAGAGERLSGRGLALRGRGLDQLAALDAGRHLDGDHRPAGRRLDGAASRWRVVAGDAGGRRRRPVPVGRRQRVRHRRRDRRDGVALAAGELGRRGTASAVVAGGGSGRRARLRPAAKRRGGGAAAGHRRAGVGADGGQRAAPGGRIGHHGPDARAGQGVHRHRQRRQRRAGARHRPGRGDRRAAVDVPCRAAARRVRPRDVAAGQRGVAARRGRRLAGRRGRSRPGHGLLRHRQPGPDVRRRDPRRRQPVHRGGAGPRHGDGGAALALPGGPARHLGRRHRHAAAALRGRDGRAHPQGAGRDAGRRPPVPVRPRDRRADRAHRGTSRCRRTSTC